MPDCERSSLTNYKEEEEKTLPGVWSDGFPAVCHAGSDLDSLYLFTSGRFTAGSLDTRRRESSAETEQATPGGSPSYRGNRKSSLFCFPSLKGVRGHIDINSEACRVESFTHKVFFRFFRLSCRNIKHFHRSVPLWMQSFLRKKLRPVTPQCHRQWERRAFLSLPQLQQSETSSLFGFTSVSPS